jgi:hypothetical protein
VLTGKRFSIGIYMSTPILLILIKIKNGFILGLSIYLWLYSPLLDLDRFFRFLWYDSLDKESAHFDAAT